jgi:signal transduction histidine kinase
VLLSVLEDGSDAEGSTLEAIDTLIRGLDVHASVRNIDKVPAATSRVAFALAREALTNALRHGSGPVSLDVTADVDVVLTVDNATTGSSKAEG